MRMEKYTIAHGPDKIFTVVSLPAFSKFTGVRIHNDNIKLLALVPKDAPYVDEYVVVYATGVEIEHYDLLEFVGSCGEGDDDWHVFRVPPKAIPYIVGSEVLTTEHIAEVCKRGQGAECCRYLMTGPDGWCCARVKGPGWEAQLDQRVAEGTMRARGSNCEGRTGAVTG